MVKELKVGDQDFSKFSVKAKFRFAATNLPGWVELEGGSLVGAVNQEVTGGLKIIKDENREKMSSQDIRNNLKNEVKQVLEQDLNQYGFHKVKEKGIVFRKIEHDIVYDIIISAVYKGQRGIRELNGYIYPLCLIEQDLFKYFSDDQI